MSIDFLFWLIMVLWFLFSVYQGWSPDPKPAWTPVGNAVLLFILFLLVGIRIFGWPIKA